jgi:hypothetical protein
MVSVGKESTREDEKAVETYLPLDFDTLSLLGRVSHQVGVSRHLTRHHISCYTEDQH